MRRKRAALAALALLLPGCTGRSESGPPAPSPSVSTPVSPAASPTPPPPASFDVERAEEHIRILAGEIGRREAVTAAYARAAAYVAAEFAKLGYEVRRQSVPIPAGSIEGVPVEDGVSDNVVAVPPGFDPARPHLVAGAHLDSVPVSPGANDNATGPAMLLELARLSRAEPTPLPIVWVAFTGEERRFKGARGGLFGSRHYVEHLQPAERSAIVAMLNVDMVGNGPVVLVCHNGRTTRLLLDAMLRSARALGVPARENIVTRFFSDHFPFEQAGIPVAWLWTGEHPTVHTPNDTLRVIRTADLRRVGIVAWETLRGFRG